MLFTPVIKDFGHQADYQIRHGNEFYFALLWEQGCAKTKPIIDNACRLYIGGHINAVLVVAPDGVDRNWDTDELPAHLPKNLLQASRAHVYKTAQTKRQDHALKLLTYHDGLAWLFMSYDAFCTKKGMDAAAKFLKTRRVYFVLDESSNIKNPTAKRTRILNKAGPLARFRRILEGTPVPNAPFDIFSQIRWLKPDFWDQYGLSTFHAFRNYFGIFKKIALPGRPDMWDPDQQRKVPAYFPHLVGYRNLGHLNEILGTISSRYVKDEVLDLPPKLYSKRYIYLNKEQAEVYSNLKSKMFAELGEKRRCTECNGTGAVDYEGFVGPCSACDGTGMATGKFVTADMAIKRMLRFQQITCGYVPADNPDPEDDAVNLVVLGKTNPRLDACIELIEQAAGKVIVWARFRRDIDLILGACKERGIKAVRYDGACREADLEAARHDFQKIPLSEGGPKVFAANPAKGGTGLTLHAAKTVIYYSNNYNLRHRLQSEDRAHRAGMSDEKVLYVDIIALMPDEKPTVDKEIVENLRDKHDIAAIVTGDKVKAWI